MSSRYRDREIFAQYSPATQAVELFFYRYDFRNDSRTQLGVVESAKLDDFDGKCPEPSITVDEVGAQRLMDQLWACGFRPTEGKGSAGALSATERHLADMRLIAFNKLGILPNDSDRPNLFGNGR